MSSSSGLFVGLKGRAALVVGDEHTAVRVGSGGVTALATPVMVTLMEAAAVDAVADAMPDGQQSVGTRLDVDHRAATPLGMRVEAEAELVAVDGRTLTFRVVARDAVEIIGEGTHVRAVIDTPRFDQRLARKAAAPGA
ncbi:hotdog domain-containing protein [Rhodoplanes sp. TEM]|uniref:Hotdog domain-containing protein n=1 Tax=Rhodoplanes tepidamans TaxID=200616 RepID=A0ABT5J5I3_RHOTP|nr:MULTISPECIES: hotdog domain-containing protein [Rhodoplanes]MDC7784886.1 hotdog domain-containing protein [Rhodoplanes tepidamans]MDC7986072.1 hotdog domain-containing protein [Rhodoplanes sp. TEM]MDQ0353885.1 putative thioesterase [Rhodoplanes tepidamans]